MNLGRFFQRLALYRASRKVPMWVLIALSVGFYLLAGIGKAHAAEGDPGFTGVSHNHSSRAAAYEGCMLNGAWYVGQTSYTSFNGCKLYPGVAEPVQFVQMMTQSNGNNITMTGAQRHNFPAAQACTQGDEYLPATDTCTPACPSGWSRNQAGVCVDPADVCRAKNSVIANPTTMVGAFGNCVDGCRIGQRTDDVKPSGKLEVSGNELQFGSVGYTGETCTTADPPPDFSKKACTQIEGQTVCVLEDGRHCFSHNSQALSSSCWYPGEVGEKAYDNNLQKREPGDTTANPTPPTPPPGDTLDQNGNPIKTTTTTNDGRTITTTTTNYTTGSGTDAGPRDPGSGTGDDGGGGEGDNGDEGPGAAGSLPTFDGPSFGSGEGGVLGLATAFKTRMEAAPIVSAATGFFDVQASGSCPSWTLPATAFTDAVVMDFWCASELSTVWTIIGAVSLICFGWVAFRIGVL